MATAYQHCHWVQDVDSQGSEQLLAVIQELPDAESTDNGSSRRRNLSESTFSLKSLCGEDESSVKSSERLQRSYSFSSSNRFGSNQELLYSGNKKRCFTKVHLGGQKPYRVETVYVDSVSSTSKVPDLYDSSQSASINKFYEEGEAQKGILGFQETTAGSDSDNSRVSKLGNQKLTNWSFGKRNAVLKENYYWYVSPYGQPTWRDHLVGDANRLEDSLNVCYRQQWAVGFTRYQFDKIYCNLSPVRQCSSGIRSSSSSSTISVTSAPGGGVSELSSKPFVRSLVLDGQTEEQTTDEFWPGQRRKVRSLSPESLFWRITNRFRKTRNSRAFRARNYRSLSVDHVFGLEEKHSPRSMFISHGQKYGDRPPYGTGSPLKQLRSYSVDTQSSSQSSRNLRQRAFSGNVGAKKTSVRRVDDEALKRSRSHSNQYELSQDLLDKQVEMLERKYGGVCARRAALTIQRAFRKYCMVKRFQELAHPNKSEKRLSRRFPTYDLEGKDWMVYAGSATSGNHMPYTAGVIYNPGQEMLKEGFQGSYSTPQNVDKDVKSNFAALFRELSETLETENGRPLKPVRSMSMREKRTCYSTDSDHCSEPSANCVYTNGNISSYSSGQVVTVQRNKDVHVVSSGGRLRTQDSLESGLPDRDNTVNDKVYCTPYVGGVRSPPSIPRHLTSNGVKHINSSHSAHLGPTVYLVPSQVPPPSEEHYCPPGESLSSEDSGISSSGLCKGSVSVMDNFLGNRESPTRRTVNVPAALTKRHQEGMLQRTPIRSSDIAIGRKCGVEQKKIPPRVPKRTSSIPNRELKSRGDGINSPTHSVQSSTSSSGTSEGSMGYDVTQQYIQDSPLPENSERGKLSNRMCSVEASPIWKRKSLVMAEQAPTGARLEDKRLSNISENSEDSLESTGYSTSPPISTSDMLQSFTGVTYSDTVNRTTHDFSSSPLLYKTQVSEIQRKRQYRVGLNLFNKKPEKGICYLIHCSFLEASPKAVARFLISRKGLSKQNIGEYLGNLQCPFNMAVLGCFVEEMDLAGMQVDVALRRFQTFFRMPGEAQKIERLVEVFSHRYIECNHEIVSKLQNPDTVFVLAFAIIMLNTDLHTPNMKAEKRMKLDDFIKNLRGVDDGNDLDRDMLTGIYERIKASEFKPGSDHVTQVMKVQQTIVGKKPNLALPHRRLVCYCRLYEIYDINKKERPGVHQREVFLFNDMIMATKIFNKKKNSITYTFRQSFPLCGMNVTLFEAPYYQYGIRLSQRMDDKVLITFNARNEHDRSKFVEDLKESILEMDEMENMRIEAELEKQKTVRNRGGDNRDSGVADMEIVPTSSKEVRQATSGHSTNLKRSALSNSLLDLHEQQINKPVRRGSAGSLDSGMSISFQSSAASTVSRDSLPQTGSVTGVTRTIVESGATPGSSACKSSNTPGFLGGLFSKKGKTSSRSNVRRNVESTTM